MALNLTDISELLDTQAPFHPLDDVTEYMPSSKVFSRQEIKQENTESTISYYPLQTRNNNHYETMNQNNNHSHTSQINDNMSIEQPHNFNLNLKQQSDQYFSCHWPQSHQQSSSPSDSENEHGLSPRSDSDSGIHSPTNSCNNYPNVLVPSSNPACSISPLPSCEVFSHKGATSAPNFQYSPHREKVLDPTMQQVCVN